MLHNLAIRLTGQCGCKCHTDSHKPCTCGAPDWMKAQAQPRKMRKVNLESRVRAFAKTPSQKRWQKGAPISVTSFHSLHEPRYYRS